MLHAVIMAGGAGTRFWPESRRQRPKQLLNLVAERSMIQMTLDRLGDLVTPQRTLVVTNDALVEAIRDQLPQLPASAVVGEPCKRDTAPCIGLAAMIVSRDDPDATMAVLPADHVIRTDEQFRAAVRLAATLVETDDESEASRKQPSANEQPALGRIVTFGIRPTYAAQSFGYIQRGEPFAAGEDVSTPIFRVDRFREKPNAEVAREYLASGEFYWNSGMFIWKARTILDALAAFAPEMYQHLERINETWGTADYAKTLQREYAAIKGTSIDYAVMEHATDILVVEAPFDWDDVGNWQSLARLHGGDDAGNTIAGKHLGLNTSGCIVRGRDDHLIVTLGLTDCIVVQTPDATLVANKHDEEAIRKLVSMIEERGWTEFL